eukprot:SAG11_NODE_4241_length_1991_cov_3.223573_3_plen_130_part_01
MVGGASAVAGGFNNLMNLAGNLAGNTIGLAVGAAALSQARPSFCAAQKRRFGAFRGVSRHRNAPKLKPKPDRKRHSRNTQNQTPGAGRRLLAADRAERARHPARSDRGRPLAGPLVGRAAPPRPAAHTMG